MGFLLEQFEVYAYSRDKENGMRELIALLDGLDANYGVVGSEFRASPLQGVNPSDIDQHVITRIASATSCLLADRELYISPEWTQKILTLHRWFASIFAASPLGNADHIMRALNIKGDKFDLRQLEVACDDLLKFCLLYTPDSEVQLDIDALRGANKLLAISLGLVLVSPRFLGSNSAHDKREQILPWLATYLDQVDDIEQLPVGVLHDLYMHCSYADRRDKHDVKKAINALIRRKLAQNRLEDRAGLSVAHKDPGRNAKPIMLVVLEWFSSAHSIYRTHSLTMESARRHFHLVAMAYENCVDDTTKNVFDEFIPIGRGNLLDELRQIYDVACKNNIAICYMPSVGMFPLTMWLANLRIAPLQLMALGHPATTHAHAIDYVVVEEDYVGDESCFSEKLLKLPKDGMPYRPSSAASGVRQKSKLRRRNPEVVQIAICATTMKLNPGFLTACAKILEKSKVKIHFKFLVGQAQGLVYPNVCRVIKRFLGDSATVYPHQSYVDYMAVIADCDMFINPFPFGNTNGIIDTVSAGLVGVCKTGAEVHEHIDEGLFRRLDFPGWLVTENADDYVAAAVRLAENHSERISLSEKFAGPQKCQTLFKGRPKIFGDELLKLLG